jgi:hypothetical protein
MMIASEGFDRTKIQLGAENNIEKSGCLAQMKKKIRGGRSRDPGFTGFPGDAWLANDDHSPRTGRSKSFLYRGVEHLASQCRKGRVPASDQLCANNTSSAPIAIETQSIEKSICPIGGIMRRTGFNSGSHNCRTRPVPGA